MASISVTGEVVDGLASEASYPNWWTGHIGVIPVPSLALVIVDE